MTNDVMPLGDNQPLVSAIIIFLNEELYLTEAIESVLKQTYSNWELLLVDDGSTDDSTAIARKYAEKYNNIRYLEHPEHQNLGMSASRNLGINHAKGKYISPLDGDDIWVANKLTEQVQILEAHPEAHMVYGPLYRWYSWNGNPEDAAKEDLYGFGADGTHPYSDSLVEAPKILTLFLKDEFFIPGGILVKREAINRVGGYEESFRGMYEDTIVLAKICLRSTVYVSSQCWYKYRMHPEACTHVSWLKGENNAAEAIYLDWLEDYLTQEGVDEPQIWQALRKTKWRCHHPKLYSAIREILHPVSSTKKLVKAIGRKILPNLLRQKLKQQWQDYKYSLSARRY